MKNCVADGLDRLAVALWSLAHRVRPVVEEKSLEFTGRPTRIMKQSDAEKAVLSLARRIDTEGKP